MKYTKVTNTHFTCIISPEEMTMITDSLNKISLGKLNDFEEGSNLFLLDNLIARYVAAELSKQEKFLEDGFAIVDAAIDNNRVVHVSIGEVELHDRRVLVSSVIYK